MEIVPDDDSPAAHDVSIWNPFSFSVLVFDDDRLGLAQEGYFILCRSRDSRSTCHCESSERTSHVPGTQTNQAELREQHPNNRSGCFLGEGLKRN